MIVTNVEGRYTIKWAERSLNKLIYRSKQQVHFESDTTKCDFQIRKVYSILQTYPLPTDLG